MKKVIIGIILGLILAGLIFFVSRVSQNPTPSSNSSPILNKVPVTGQGIFDGINAHRKSIEVAPLKLDSRLCNNLNERKDVAKAGNGNSGFSEWEQNSIKAGDFNRLLEMYSSFEKYRKSMPENTYPELKDFINPWLSSPGNKLAIEDPSLTFTCTYSDGYTAVVILAN